MATGQRKEPARLLKDLIGQMGSSELSDWRPDILRIVDEFTKKPRKELLAILDGRNPGRSDSGRREAGVARSPESPSISPASPLATEFRHALEELRDRHIFQWSTFYRDCLDSYFDRYLDAIGASFAERSRQGAHRPAGGPRARHLLTGTRLRSQDTRIARRRSASHSPGCRSFWPCRWTTTRHEHPAYPTIDQPSPSGCCFRPP